MIEAVARNALWIINGLVIVYFVLLNGAYFATSLLAFRALRRYAARLKSVDIQEFLVSAGAPPITLIVPAYDEEATCVDVVRSLLTLNYPEYEVIIVNDGSRDATADRLASAFEMVPAARMQIADFETAPIHGIFRSRWHPNLWLVDKDNGGKADALNSGLAFCQTPLFCVMDADTILERDALIRIVRPFLEDQRTVAAGGVVRVVNGCTVESGSVVDIRLPRNWLAQLQVLEYLRAFLAGRMGWHALNSTLIISGAFGVFRRSVAVGAGGFRTDVVGEDIELVVRLQLLLSGRGEALRHRLRSRSSRLDRGAGDAGSARAAAGSMAAGAQRSPDAPSENDLQSQIWADRTPRDAPLLSARDARSCDRADRLRGVRRHRPTWVGDRLVRFGLLDGCDRSGRGSLCGGRRSGGDHLPPLPSLPGPRTTLWPGGDREYRLPLTDYVMASEGDGRLSHQEEGLG